MNLIPLLFSSRGRLAAAGLLAAAFVSAACGGKRERPDGKKPVVFASIAPVAGLARRIAGERATVESLAGSDQDPHGFSPSARQVVALGEADAFLTVGMPFEDVLAEKLADAARGLRVVDLTAGVDLLEMDGHHHHDHGHEEEGHDHGHEEEEEDDAHDHEHGHEEGHSPASEPGNRDEELSDTHVWLSPALLKQMAMVIEHTLHEIDPAGHDEYHANLEQVLADLDALDAELRETLAPLEGQSFYVFHGAFAYFARDYGLVQEAIETGGRSPEPRRVFELIEQAKADGVRLIIVQPQFDTKSAEAIAEGIGGAVVAVNPTGEDVFETLRELAAQVRASRAEAP